MKPRNKLAVYGNNECADAEDEKMLKTSYDSIWSTDGAMVIIVAIGAALFMYVLVENIRSA